jgi:hypothetical protein
MFNTRKAEAATSQSSILADMAQVAEMSTSMAKV